MDRNIENVKKLPSQDIEKTDEVLNMSPQELRNFLVDLENKDRLTSFLNMAVEDKALKGMLSYWEKWLEEGQAELLEEIINEKKNIYLEKNIDEKALPLDLEKKFDTKELELIFSNMGGIQLTFGCSRACPFCAVDAKKGVTDHIPYSQLANLFEKFGKQLKETQPPLYWASEPSDYDFEGKTYQDIHELALKAGCHPNVTTRNFTSENWLKSLQDNVTWPRVSVFGADKNTIEKIETEYEMPLVGRGESHAQGIGKTFMQDKRQIKRTGICCHNGTLLTPRGTYNVVQVPISEKFPQGQIIEPIVLDENLKNKPIEEGDYLPSILRNIIVEYNDYGTGALPTSYIKILNAHLILNQNGKKFIVTLNKDYTIKKVLPFEKFEEIKQECLQKKDYKGYSNAINSFMESDEIQRNYDLSLDDDLFPYWSFEIKYDNSRKRYIAVLSEDNKKMGADSAIWDVRGEGDIILKVDDSIKLEEHWSPGEKVKAKEILDKFGDCTLEIVKKNN